MKTLDEIKETLQAEKRYLADKYGVISKPDSYQSVVLLFRSTP
jgi:hypothetical protein